MEIESVGTVAAMLLEAVPDAIVVADQSGLITHVNRAATEVFGHTADEFTGMSVDQLVPAERRDAHRAVRERFSAAPERRPMGTGLRLAAQHREGHLFPVEVSLSPVSLGDGLHVIAVVRDVSERQADAAKLALLRDRERIARDIHDMVIQRLFGAGMSLQAVVGAAEPPLVSDRIVQVIDELDETIRQLRTAIFQLTVQQADTPVSEKLASLVRERTVVASFDPELVVSGEIDDLAADLAEQLLATLGEALANVTRHARAEHCTVEIEVGADELTLVVTDNGVGFPEEVSRRGGTRNMVERAALLGGYCSIEPGEGAGTVVEWSVPLSGLAADQG